MKNFKTKILALLIVGFTINLSAQTDDNPWEISLGVSAIDFFPVGGENEYQGGNLEDFFNIDEHWNISPSLSYLSVGRNLKDNVSFKLSGAYNQIEKWGSINVAKLNYFNLSGSVNYSLSDGLNLGKIDPFFGVGMGYSWIEVGDYNVNPSDPNADYSSFLTTNGAFGISYWATDYIGLTLQTTYNYAWPSSVKESPSHYRHTLGLSVRFGGTDTDGDGVYDKKDLCPEVPGLEAFNGCPDTDGDGVQDSEDTCPDAAGLAEFSGCPDTDGDRVSDNNDRCPEVAGLASMNGCPDSDGDGITDLKDSCPNEAGPRGNRGCPWPDSDGDSVLDKDDKCPKEPGSAATNGCPDKPSAEVQKTLASYAKTINFEYGKSSYKAEAEKTLKAIVAIIIEYPKAKFVIEGHTDGIGSEGFNQTLSEERAESILTFLMSNGVDASRLTAKGYGESSPIASNSTEAGRAMNRRVDVKLAN